MSSVVFNSFKQRFLNGEVPQEDTWSFVPVNKTFNETFVQSKDKFKLEQYRSLDDLYDHNFSAMDESFFGGIRTDYDFYKPRDTSGTNKPMFITSGVFDRDGNQISASNWEEFQTTEFYKDVSGNVDIESYLASGGFYYILKKDELRWFADRVNSGNNRIIGVFGDGIDGVIRGQIGKNEDYPFQGILDGNGHALENATVVCDNEDNGVVGILGIEGTVKNFRIVNDESFLNDSDNVSLKCEKTIDINHIKKSGRDINAGILVGRNYGKIENINAHELGQFRFSGFVPQVYSVTNKADDYNDFSTVRAKFDEGENFYYLNSWCINSPGNICPYVGYFAEGLFAQSARGRDNLGNVVSIESYPTLKSKYNAGLCDATLNLNSKVSYLAMFVKAGCGSNKKVGIYTGDKAKYLQDKRYCQGADTLWGTNAIMFLGYNTKDEKGKNVKYFLEINGTAYDKKSGKGKRRYYFHAGHFNYKKNLKYLTKGVDFDEMQWVDLGSEPDNVLSNKGWYPVGWGTKWALKGAAVFSNGGDLTSDDGIADDDFEIDDDDIRVYTEDGTPAKIVSIDYTALRWQPRNKDTSSAVFKDIWFYLKLYKNTYWYSATVKDSEQKTHTVLFAVCVNTDTELCANANNNHLLGLWSALNFINYNCGQPWGDATVEQKGWAYSDGSPRCTGRYIYYEGDLTKEAALEKFTAGDVGEEIPENMKETCCNAISLRIAEDAASEDPYMFHWEYGKNTNGPDHYASRILVDDSDKTEFETYLKNRQPTWINGTTYDGLHKYDLLINSDNGICAKGTLVMTLLQVSEFQYRPFVHASEPSVSPSTDNHIYVDDTNPATFEKNGSVFPGARFGNVSANCGAEATLNYFTQQAYSYIRNPAYYGMDVDGLWTTNCVRPDPENDPWNNLTAKRESWCSTLNFNWNIMRQMFDTDNDHYTRMAEYDAINDPEPWRYDSHYVFDWQLFTHKSPITIYKGLDFTDKKYLMSDIPHAILNKPLKMNTMARAAYYVSPIVGSNYGRIQHVVVSAERMNRGNFVGFLGSIAGKQERGLVDYCSVYAKDKFNYFEDEPVKPDYNTMDETAFSAAMAKYDNDCKHYNYQVRYKATPIMPPSVSEAVTTLSENPDASWEDYEFYPRGSDTRIDSESAAAASGGSGFGGKTGWEGLKKYYDSIGVTWFMSASNEVDSHGGFFNHYSANPDYIYDKKFYDISSPIRAFTSAWYDDYNVTAENVLEDVVTYKLRPIFNAGGLFGKIIPTYNRNTMDLTGLDPMSGTTFQNCNVHYILDDAVPESAVNTLDLLHKYSKDIHDTFGAIAGMLEIQTSETCQWNKNVENTIILNEVNVSAEGNTKTPVLPIGFAFYQPNELPSMAATEGSPRQKAGTHAGEYTETTYAIDLPVVINNYVGQSKNNMSYSPINQSSAAFYETQELFNHRYGESSWFNGDGWMTGSASLPYIQHVVNKVFTTRGNVNINTTALTYCNPSALEIKWGRRGPQCIDSLFGSYTTFIPAFPLYENAKDETSALKEQLCGKNNPRTYVVGHEVITATKDAAGNGFDLVTNFSPINIDCLNNTEIFKKGNIKDIYFDYTYSSKSAYVDDWTFTQDVKFTSALDVDKYNKGIKPSDTNIRLGYVFRDSLNYSGNGFWYNNNYLHLGNSVSPWHIRNTLAETDHLLTSGAAGYYYNDEGELVSANDKHSFGGFLVLDSEGRTVMFIDNTSGAKIEDGGSYNLQCSPVVYNGTSGGMLLEVK